MVMRRGKTQRCITEALMSDNRNSDYAIMGKDLAWCSTQLTLSHGHRFHDCLRAVILVNGLTYECISCPTSTFGISNRNRTPLALGGDSLDAPGHRGFGDSAWFF